MCGITGIINSQGNINPPAYIQRMTDALRHRGPDDEGFTLFQSGGQEVWIYGGRDTPRNVYDADLTYTPLETFSGQRHGNVLLALGHRRLSIIDLSPGGHQPMCTPDRRYWIVYNGEIYNYLELKEELLQEGYSFSSRSDTEVLLTAYVHWGEDALKRLVGMFAFAIYDRQERLLFLARDFLE
jgi:asparagine synthase (glutamine-hydrolysing)